MPDDGLLKGLHLLDRRLAAGVQPRVVDRRGAPLLVHCADAGHLSVEGDGDDVRGIDATSFHTLADRARRRSIEILWILLLAAGPRVGEL